jgi:hypothetical protein
MGCCNQFGNCEIGSIDQSCGIMGSFCQNCLNVGAVCQVGQCIPLEAGTLCSQTCSGCCDKAGNCQPGFLTAQCGQNGANCEDCTAIQSICDVNVEPRVCVTEQTQCPAMYPGCQDGFLQPVLTPQKVCSMADLQAAAVACATGANTFGCQAFFTFENQTNPTCGGCLQTFDYDFSQGTGILACAAPYLDTMCNHEAACLNDCATQSCSGCPDDPSTASCENQVGSASGQCSAYSQGVACVAKAVLAGGPGAVCNPAAYPSGFGAWLQAVGGQYCGP